MDLVQWVNEKRYSMIEDEFPDKEKFPLYYKAHKQEFIIEPGQMLFIPPGWFHFVFSEDPDPETKLNFAVNYWYEPSESFSEGTSGFKGPYVADCPIPITKLDPFEIFRPLGLLKVWRSPNTDTFYSGTLFTRCLENGSHNEFMTFDEFYETQNPEYYLLQYQNIPAIDALVPKHDTPLINSSCWINFGNIKTQMHYDGMDNWLCQVHGRKRILLFPPEDRDLLYMYNKEPYHIIKQIEKIQNDYIFPFVNRNRIILSPEFIKDTIDILGSTAAVVIPDAISLVPPKKAEKMKKMYETLFDCFMRSSSDYYNDVFIPKNITSEEIISSNRFVIFKSGMTPPPVDHNGPKPKVTMIIVLSKGASININGEDYKNIRLGGGIMLPASFLFRWTVPLGVTCIVST